MTDKCINCGVKLKYETFYAEEAYSCTYHKSVELSPEDMPPIRIPYCSNKSCPRYGLLSLSKEQLDETT